MRSSLTALAAVLLAVATLTVSGCGLKGDLYLPASESTTPPADAPEGEPDEEAANKPDA